MIKYFVFLFFLAKFSFIYSQNWVFRIKPGFKPLSISTFREKAIDFNNSNSQILPAYVNNRKNHALWFNPAFFESELLIDLRESKTKLFHAGIGWSNYHHFFQPALFAKGTITINDIEYTRLSGVWPDEVVSFYNQYFFYLTCNPFKKDSKLKHFFTSGLGLNVPFRTNMSEFELHTPDDLDGFNGFNSKLKRNNSFFNLTPMLFLRYELGIFTKKNRNLFNLNFSFYQGIIKDFTYSIDASFDNGAYMNYEYIIRTSGFRIGLSKNFVFKKATFK